MTSKKHEVPEELMASLLANYKKPEDLIGESGLLKELTKLLVEKTLDAELSERLVHERHETVGKLGVNTRNGKSKKTLKGDFGELPIVRSPATAMAVSSASSVPTFTSLNLALLETRM